MPSTIHLINAPSANEFANMRNLLDVQAVLLNYELGREEIIVNKSVAFGGNVDRSKQENDPNAHAIFALDPNAGHFNFKQVQPPLLILSDITNSGLSANQQFRLAQQKIKNFNAACVLSYDRVSTIASFSNSQKFFTVADGPQPHLDTVMFVLAHSLGLRKKYGI